MAKILRIQVDVILPDDTSAEDAKEIFQELDVKTWNTISENVEELEVEDIEFVEILG